MQSKRGEEFKFSTGKLVSNLKDLSNLLKKHPEIYLQHTRGGNNDFADWIEQAMHNKTLANKLKKSSSLPEFIQYLDAYVKPKIHNYKTKKKEEKIVRTIYKTTIPKQTQQVAIIQAPEKNIITSDIIIGILLGLFIGLIIGRILS
jgi:F0F1-type ATP synthase assembly protein I